MTGPLEALDTIKIDDDDDDDYRFHSEKIPGDIHILDPFTRANPNPQDVLIENYQKEQQKHPHFFVQSRALTKKPRDWVRDCNLSYFRFRSAVS